MTGMSAQSHSRPADNVTVSPGPLAASTAGPRHPDVRRMLDARKRPGKRPTDASVPQGPGHEPGEVVLVEGKWAHRLLLERGAEIETLLWCPEVGTESPGATELAPWVARAARRTYEISGSTLRRVSARNAPDGLVSLVRLPVWDPATVVTPSDALVLVVDGVNYAGNLGNLIRTADGAGASAVLVTNPGVNRSHPLVFTASRGALLTMPLLEFDTVGAGVDWLAERGFVCLLADPEADQDYAEVDYASESVAVVVGSEGSGLSAAWSEAPHRAVSIPLSGVVDSLNVGTAAAVMLFEVARQRRP